MAPGGARIAVLVVAVGVGAKLRRQLATVVMPLLQPLRACVLLSLIGGLATLRVVPHMRASFAKAGLTGIDLNKQTTRRLASGELVRPYEGVAVPEAMGAVSCAVYLVCLFLFIPLPFAQPGVPAYSDGAFPHAQLARLLCALLSICCMCFLGFADNVLDLRWRDRLILPLAASLPVLMTYAATGGVTTVKVPAAAQALLGLGGSVDIGALYFVYISLLAIFCTNAINILAGVNGLEVGQSVVIGLTIAAFNCVQVRARARSSRFSRPRHPRTCRRSRRPVPPPARAASSRAGPRTACSWGTTSSLSMSSSPSSPPRSVCAACARAPTIATAHRRAPTVDSAHRHVSNRPSVA